MKSLLLICLVSCTRPGEGRALDELTVGHAEIEFAKVDVTEGLAVVRELSDGKLDLWSGAPVIDLSFTTDAGDWTILARNSLADAVLTVDGAVFGRQPGDAPTTATFQISLTAGTHRLRARDRQRRPDPDRRRRPRRLTRSLIGDRIYPRNQRRSRAFYGRT